MLRNNIITVIFQFVFSLIIIIISDDQTLGFYKSLLWSIIIGIVYFIFGYISVKWYVQYDSKRENLLSFSSVIFINIFLIIISFSTFEFALLMFFGIFYAPFLYIGSTIAYIFGDKYQYIIIGISSIPYILLMWLGSEVRRKRIS